MEENLVSIIMPSYNAEKFILKTLDSVLEQTYSNWELLIIDDCSTDSTVEIIENYKKNHPDKKILLNRLEKNSGAAVCRNEALKISSGRFVCFLDSDDIWMPTKLEKQVLFMLKNNAGLSATSYNKIDEIGNELNVIIKAREKYNFNRLLKYNVGNSTVMYDSLKVGKISIPDIKKRNDYLYWLTILSETGESILGINEVLSSHRVVSTSLSSNKSSLVKYHWIVYREHLNLSLFKSVYLTLFWISKGIINKMKIPFLKINVRR